MLVLFIVAPAWKQEPTFQLGPTPVPSAQFAQQLQAMQAVIAQRSAQSDKQWSYIKDLLTIVLPAETGLLGAAFGFYFGIKAAQGQAGNP